MFIRKQLGIQMVIAKRDLSGAPQALCRSPQRCNVARRQRRLSGPSNYRSLHILCRDTVLRFADGLGKHIHAFPIAGHLTWIHNYEYSAFAADRLAEGRLHYLLHATRPLHPHLHARGALWDDSLQLLE